jgi:putative restriction endonuclease
VTERPGGITRLETPAGPYAEAAHVRPLGWDHRGPDVPGNVLCLCPNHHVLLDAGAFSVADDLSLVGLPGRCRTTPGHVLDPACLAYHRAQILGGGR